MGQAIDYLSILSPLLPIAIGFKQRKSLLWIYAVIGISYDLLMTGLSWYDSVYHTNSNIMKPIYYSFPLVEFLIVSLYYRAYIYSNKLLFTSILTLLSSLYLIGICYPSVTILNFLGSTIFDVAFIIYALRGFYVMLKEQRILVLYKSDFFWVNVAFLIYCSANFQIFLFDKYLQPDNKHFFEGLWMFHNILNIIFSILIAISFFVKNRE